MASNSNSAPGVYGNIIDLTNRIEQAVRSSAAFVGGAKKGDVNTRIFLTDHQQLHNELGERDIEFSPLQYCIDPYLYQSASCYAVRVINGALWAGAYLTVDDCTAKDPILRLTNFTGDGSNKPVGKDDPMNTVGFDPTQSGIENIVGFFCAKDPGEWNNKITVMVKPNNPTGIPIRGNGHDVSTFVVEVYYDLRNSSTPPVERFVVTRRPNVDGVGNQRYIEDVLKKSKYVRFKSNPYCPEFDMVSECSETFGGGDDGLPPTHDQIAEAWELFEDTEAVKINLLVNCGYASPVVQHRMDSIAKRRLDSIAILDLPSDKQEVVDAMNYKKNELNLSSSDSAIYGSDVLIYDETTDEEIYVPVSGYIASRYAFVDNNRAVWFAPAGVDAGVLPILGTRVHYDQGARDALFDAQINPIRKVPAGFGFCIWDQLTTLNQASSLRDVSVVRLSKMILVSSMMAMNSKLFDPNTAILRAFIKQMADDFMKPIKQQGGVYEYNNVCDEKNNTPETIANGDVNMDMIYEPTINTRRVHVVFNLNKVGSTFTG